MLLLQFRILLVESVFLLFEPAFGIFDFRIFLIHEFFVVRLELNELLLGLKYLFLLDVLSLQFCLLDDFIPAALQKNPPCNHVDGQSKHCTC